MLYIATIPGFIVSLGMQFAVESPRWLCKVGLFHHSMQESTNSPSWLVFQSCLSSHCLCRQVN